MLGLEITLAMTFSRPRFSVLQEPQRCGACIADALFVEVRSHGDNSHGAVGVTGDRSHP